MAVIKNLSHFENTLSRMKNVITQSLANGLRILLTFDSSSPLLTVHEITEQLGYSQATAYRLVRTLVEFGFLRQVTGGPQYALGLETVRLGLIGQETLNLSEIALPFMKELSSRTCEAVLLTVVDGTQGMCLAKIETEGPIRLSLKPGTSLPLHSGASTKVLMAYLGEEDWDRIIKKEGLKRFTPNTITQVEKLKVHLKEIRRKGYAVSDQEVDSGVRAVGAPIFDGSGKLVAGLSVAGPIHRISKKRFLSLSQLVVQYAQKISNALGYSPKAIAARNGETGQNKIGRLCKERRKR